MKYDPDTLCTDEKNCIVPHEFIEGVPPVSSVDSTVVFDICQINHYAIRSKEEFSWKARRGNGRKPLKLTSDGYADNYFKLRDLNDEIDLFAVNKYLIPLLHSIDKLPETLLSPQENCRQRFLRAYMKIIAVPTECL